MTTHNKLEEAFGKIEKSQWMAQAEARQKERMWKKRSQQIALNVLDYLHESKMSQKVFAERMAVSPQIVNKWLKGSENLTLETICKIETVLGFDLIEIKSKAEKKNNYSSMKFEKKIKYEKSDASTGTIMKTAIVVTMQTSYPKINIS